MPWEPTGFLADEPVLERAQPEAEPGIDAHRLAARRFYPAAPPYCIRFEDNGMVTLRRKDHDYYEDREPELATIWTIISTHEDLDEVERCLRMICSASLYYDAEGRPAKSPRKAKPRWPMPPTDGEEASE
jgi:hypothetical protein